MTHLIVHNSSKTKYENIEMVEMPDREFKDLEMDFIYPYEIELRNLLQLL
jgi:hypothetical protein